MKRRSFLAMLGIVPAINPASATVSTGWCDIESCPQDGTPFLAKRLLNGKWSRIYEVTYVRIDWQWTPHGDERSHAAHFEGWPRPHIGPTHWRPSP